MSEKIGFTRQNRPIARRLTESTPPHEDVRRSVEGLRRLQKQIRRGSRAGLSESDVRNAIERGRR
jgi:hypothetical protein